MASRKLSKQEEKQKGWVTKENIQPHVESRDYVGTWTNKNKDILRVVGIEFSGMGFQITLKNGKKQIASILEKYKMIRISTSPDHVVSIMDYDIFEDEMHRKETNVPNLVIAEKFERNHPKIDLSGYKDKKVEKKAPDIVTTQKKEVTTVNETPKTKEIVKTPKPTQEMNTEKQLLNSFFSKKKKKPTYNLTIQLPIDKVMLEMLMDMDGVDLNLICDVLSENVSTEQLRDSIKHILENFVDEDDTQFE